MVVDPGGSFHFRAQGGYKPYDEEPSELQSLLDPSRPSGEVFKTLNRDLIRKTAYEYLPQFRRSTIYKMFLRSGLDEEKAKQMADTFMKRRNNILKTLAPE